MTNALGFVLNEKGTNHCVASPLVFSSSEWNVLRMRRKSMYNRDWKCEGHVVVKVFTKIDGISRRCCKKIQLPARHRLLRGLR